MEPTTYEQTVNTLRFLELRSAEKEINNEREASIKRGEELPEIRRSCRGRDRRSDCEGGSGAVDVAVAGEGPVAGGCSAGVGNLESIMQEAEGSVGFLTSFDERDERVCECEGLREAAILVD